MNERDSQIKIGNKFSRWCIYYEGELKFNINKLNNEKRKDFEQETQVIMNITNKYDCMSHYF